MKNGYHLGEDGELVKLQILLRYEVRKMLQEKCRLKKICNTISRNSSYLFMKLVAKLIAIGLGTFEKRTFQYFFNLNQSLK